jgi:hypothetical protein
MSLRIDRGGKPVSGYVADRRLYLVADKSRVVEEGHPDAAFLLCSPGKVVPEAEAKRLGLLKEPEPVKAEPEPVKESPKKKPRGA